MAYNTVGTYTITLTITDALGNTSEAQLTIQIEDCGTDPCLDLPLTILLEDEICTGEPTELAFDFPGNVTSATWQLGNGASANGVNPTAVYSNAGNYTVTLTLQDDLNCIYTATATLFVTACSGCGTEAVGIDYIGVPCVDSTLFFPIPSSIEDNTFAALVWLVDGEVFADQAPLSVSFEQAGTYLIQLEALTIEGCPYFGEFVVNVEDCGNNPCANLPPVEIIPPQAFCIGQPLSFTLETTADLVSYSWEANNGDTGDSPTFTTTFSESGVATIFVQAFDENGCAYGAAIESDLVPCGNPCDDLPAVDLFVEGDLCQDSLLFFDAATDATLQAYTWALGDGQVSNEANPEISYTEAGLYTVTLTADDANGCLYTDTLELIIEECLPPDPCADQPALQILADSVVCVDSVQQFSAIGPDSLVLYDWQLDGGQRSEEAMPTAVYETPGLYAAVLVAVDPEGCTYSDNFAFEVEFCEPEGGCYYVFPNTFTPNGDQTNDRFGLLANCPVTDYQLRIFNRWGEEVFTTDDPQISWDGQFNGKAAPVEVYFFVTTFQKADGGREQIQGDVNLVR